MCSLLGATYAISSVIDQDGEELAKPREEHARVAELSREDEAYNELYCHATGWAELGCMWRLLIVSAAILALVSGFMFAMLNEVCFENFSLQSKINDPIS